MKTLKLVVRALSAVSGILLLALLALLLSGCMGLPTVAPAPTAAPTNPPPPTATAAVVSAPVAPLVVVTIIGDVWLRDNSDIERGYLLQGTEVQAVCDGEWCHMGGLKFYRGCTTDNPMGLACRTR